MSDGATEVATGLLSGKTMQLAIAAYMLTSLGIQIPGMGGGDGKPGPIVGLAVEVREVVKMARDEMVERKDRAAKLQKSIDDLAVAQKAAAEAGGDQAKALLELSYQIREMREDRKRSTP